MELFVEVHLMSKTKQNSHEKISVYTSSTAVILIWA